MASNAFLQPLSGPPSARVVSAHEYSGNAFPGGWDTYPDLAAAGLWTTPSDLAKVVLDVQQAAMGRGTVLSAATVEQMLATQAGEDYGSKMGLGFKVKPLGNDIQFSHTGDNAGFKTYLIGYRDSGKGAFVMTNSQNGEPLMLEIMRSIAKGYDGPDITPEARELIDAPRGVLAAYAGGYGPPGGGVFNEVALSGVQLAIRFPGIAVLNELYAVAADNFIFFGTPGGGLLAFTRDAAGHVDGMTINIGGGSATVQKK